MAGYMICCISRIPSLSFSEKYLWPSAVDSSDFERASVYKERRIAILPIPSPSLLALRRGGCKYGQFQLKAFGMNDSGALLANKIPLTVARITLSSSWAMSFIFSRNS